MLKNKGFSLVEIVVVIAIMAVLVGVLAPIFIRYIEKSRQGTDLQNLDSVVDSLEAYFSDKDMSGSGAPVMVTVTLGTVLQTSGMPSGLDPEQELVDMGIISSSGTALPLKAKNWSTSGSGNTTVPSVVYNVTTNTKKYTGESEYYKANDAGTSIDAK